MGRCGIGLVAEFDIANVEAGFRLPHAAPNASIAQWQCERFPIS